MLVVSLTHPQTELVVAAGFYAFFVLVALYSSHKFFVLIALLTHLQTELVVESR